MKADYLPIPIERIIEAATWAPSSHNTQPWKFTVEEEEIYIFPDFNRGLPVADPQYRELIISLGCALENLIVAARHEGFAAQVRIFPPEVDGIVVRLKPFLFPPDVEQEELFEAIARRQTTRRPYDGRELPPLLKQAILSLPLEEGVYVRLLADAADREKAADLVRLAEEYWMEKPAYRRELADWVRFSRPAAERLRDGLTAAASGRGWVPEWLGRFFLRFLQPAGAQVKEDMELIRSASGLLLFHTAANNPQSWVRLGRSFERMALTLTRLGLKHAHHNQPCEIPALHSEFRRRLHPGIAHPQLLVRIGFGEEMPRSPRRELEKVIV